MKLKFLEPDKYVWKDTSYRYYKELGGWSYDWNEAYVTDLKSCLYKNIETNILNSQAHNHLMNLSANYICGK